MAITISVASNNMVVSSRFNPQSIRWVGARTGDSIEIRGANDARLWAFVAAGDDYVEESNQPQSLERWFQGSGAWWWNSLL